MPYRAVLRRELAAFLSVLSHPARLAIVEALEPGEQDVNSLAAAAGIAASATSQHLSVLRAHRLVVERRDGRRVLYHLTVPQLPAWLVDGLSFVEAEGQAALEVNEALKTARKVRNRTLKATGART